MFFYKVINFSYFKCSTSTDIEWNTHTIIATICFVIFVALYICSFFILNANKSETPIKGKFFLITSFVALQTGIIIYHLYILSGIDMIIKTNHENDFIKNSWQQVIDKYLKVKSTMNNTTVNQQNLIQKNINNLNKTVQNMTDIHTGPMSIAFVSPEEEQTYCLQIFQDSIDLLNKPTSIDFSTNINEAILSLLNLNSQLSSILKIARNELLPPYEISKIFQHNFILQNPSISPDLKNDRSSLLPNFNVSTSDIFSDQPGYQSFNSTCYKISFDPLNLYLAFNPLDMQILCKIDQIFLESVYITNPKNVVYQITGLPFGDVVASDNLPIIRVDSQILNDQNNLFSMYMVNIVKTNIPFITDTAPIVSKPTNTLIFFIPISNSIIVIDFYGYLPRNIIILKCLQNQGQNKSIDYLNVSVYTNNALDNITDNQLKTSSGFKTLINNSNYVNQESYNFPVGNNQRLILDKTRTIYFQAVGSIIYFDSRLNMGFKISNNKNNNILETYLEIFGYNYCSMWHFKKDISSNVFDINDIKKINANIGKIISQINTSVLFDWINWQYN